MKLLMSHEEAQEHLRVLVQRLLVEVGRDPSTWRRYGVCDCGRIRTRRARLCADCAAEQAATEADGRYPSLEEIVAGVSRYGVEPFARGIGVSGNALRKHLWRRGIEPPSRSNGRLEYPHTRVRWIEGRAA